MSNKKAKHPKKQELNNGKHSYEECSTYVQTKIQELKDTRELKSFCKDKGINYRTVVTFADKGTSYKAPNLIEKLMKVFGYEVKMEKEVVYHVTKK